MHSLSVVFHDRKVVLLDPCGLLSFCVYLVPSFSLSLFSPWLSNALLLLSVYGAPSFLKASLVVLLKENTSG